MNMVLHQLECRYLHGDGAANAEDDAAVIVIDRDEKGRLGDVDVERRVDHLVVAGAARLFQR